MSDTSSDLMTESRVIVLGLSPADFKQFLLDEGVITDLEMRANPGLVCKLMSRDDLWEEYEKMAEARYEARQSDEADRQRSEGSLG